VIKARRHASAIAFPILIWGAIRCFITLIRTVLLRAADSLFVIYIKNFATLNAVYGAFSAGVKRTMLFLGFGRFLAVKHENKEFDQQTRMIIAIEGITRGKK
jgi:hypothetical protein